MQKETWLQLVLLIYHSILSKAASVQQDRKSTRLNSSNGYIAYAVFCLRKRKGARAVSASALGHPVFWACGTALVVDRQPPHTLTHTVAPHRCRDQSRPAPARGAEAPSG